LEWKIRESIFIPRYPLSAETSIENRKILIGCEIAILIAYFPGNDTSTVRGEAVIGNNTESTDIVDKRKENDVTVMPKLLSTI
jgi:hypothetical protein